MPEGIGTRDHRMYRLIHQQMTAIVIINTLYGLC